MPAVRRCAPMTPSTTAQDRARNAHGKTFQNQHAHNLFSRRADGPEDGKLPPPLADVHQEGVEDHENGEHDVQPENESQALLGVFQGVLATSASAPRACELASRRAIAAARSACTLFSSAPGFQYDARPVDAAGFGIIILGRAKRQKDDAALIEIRRPARRKQPDDVKDSHRPVAES